MGRLHEIRLKSDQFIGNINVHIAESIKNVEDDLLKINKSQMLSSLDSDGSPLVHKETGNKNVTVAYQQKTGKITPNLFLSGDFQKSMFLEVNENDNSFFIDSEDWKNGILTENYGSKIFGIPQDKETRSKELTSRSFKRNYESFVLRR